MKVRIQAKRRFSHRNRELVRLWVWQARFAVVRERILSRSETAEAAAKREADFNAFWDDLIQKQAVRQLVEPCGEEFTVVDSVEEVVKASIEYVVAKKSTGEVVGTFDLREDALEMIEKAKRNKKAALVLLDTAA